MLRVKDIMDRNPCVIEKGKRLFEALDALEKWGVEGLAVLEKDGKVIGIITEGDIVRAILLTYEELVEETLHLEEAERRATFALNKRVEEVMSTPPVIVTEEVPLMRILSLMAIKRVGYLPVVDKEGKIKGAVRRKELLKALRRL